MSNHDQNHAQVPYPSSSPNPYVAPPPANYAVKNGNSAPSPTIQTTSKGGGFWRGFCAGLCCHCCLDACF
ncbi:hypothetical protein P3X46_002811 [Hevea brasiliensis]|uniref:Cysteine-rich transmembrane domain-containing protein n=1 Tax=Hevea brasiliensis TaxID=3981 RepID=A0ABQ9N6N0_HEVBR|nr:hypothetical protein P3X46_002811 [Hevea brasiliensis]